MQHSSCPCTGPAPSLWSILHFPYQGSQELPVQLISRTAPFLLLATCQLGNPPPSKALLAWCAKVLSGGSLTCKGYLCLKATQLGREDSSPRKILLPLHRYCSSSCMGATPAANTYLCSTSRSEAAKLKVRTIPLPKPQARIRWVG